MENKKNPALLIVVTVILWILSAIIAFLLIVPILDSIITIYASFWADPNPIGQSYYLGASIRQLGVLIIAILFVIGIIGGAEHHARNFNTPSSWQFMFMTFAVEITLIMFVLLF
ncbi:MAG: hypothetical protein ACK2TV_16290 [Anaerolineales bacterium]